MDDRMTVAVRFVDGSSLFRSVTSSAVPVALRKLEVFSRGSFYLREHGNRLLGTDDPGGPIPGPQGIVLLDYEGDIVLQINDFTPIEYVDVAHVAFSFQQWVNQEEREAIAVFAQAGRLARAVRRRDTSTGKAEYIREADAMQLSEFDAMISAPVKQPRPVDGILETPLFRFDLSPFVVETLRWDGRANKNSLRLLEKKLQRLEL